MMRIITSVIRPELKYAAVVWSQTLKESWKGYKGQLRRCYQEFRIFIMIRLEEMELTTLQDRREQGDVITIYKVVNGIEKVYRQDLRANAGVQTRENTTKIKKIRCVRDIR